MNKKLKEKIYESLTSVLPITIIVFILSITATPLPIGLTIMFLVGAFMLVVGMGFFSLGADIAMMPMGEAVGGQFGKTANTGILIFVSFLMGFIITVAEPDLQVLAQQVPSVPNRVLIVTVGLGVGIFLVIATLRTLYRIGLSQMLIFFYVILFLLAKFVPGTFVPVAFDSGGVTTGPITVPFLLAIGAGMASMRGGENAQDDSFGLVALCSIGPIMAVMLMGIVYNPTDATYVPVQALQVETTRDVAAQFAKELPHYLKDVLIALVPICLFFLGLQAVSRQFKKRQMIRIGIGFVYTMIGLVLFLTGVNVGFIPVGHLIGSSIGEGAFKWALIPLGMVVGYFIVAAEPAVHVLNKQVEEISSGAVSQKIMMLALSLGVAVSVALSMLRVLTGISIFWLIIPGYVIALILTFFVPKMFVGVAFDSGGVASGPMTTTFLLPFAMGACEGVGGNVLIDAFGCVAMVAMTPLIAIQLMGLIYARQMKAASTLESIEGLDLAEVEEIIEYEEESSS